MHLLAIYESSFGKSLLMSLAHFITELFVLWLSFLSSLFVLHLTPLSVAQFKHFFPFCWLRFDLVVDRSCTSLDIRSFLHNVIPFLLLAVTAYASEVFSNKSVTVPVPCRIFPIFPSSDLMVSGLRFRPWSTVSWCLYKVKIWHLIAYFCAWRPRFSQHHLLKCSLFPWY